MRLETTRYTERFGSVRINDLLDTLKQIPLARGVASVIRQLEEQGHFLATISDSYTLATEHLKKELGFDPKSPLVAASADIVLKEDFGQLLEVIGG